VSRGDVATACAKADAYRARDGQSAEPQNLYLAAVALRGAGDTKGTAVMATRAAKFNGLSLNYGYVRARAASIGS
jgi:hypothetical protein